MNSPLVSICIPTYNGEKYLVECLDSCVNQSFKDYEIIICDDGSSDKTLFIIEDYADKFSFIKFIKNELNLGLVGNWNKCLNLSSGKWIKFVFQDDYITNNCLEKFVKEITNSNQLIVCKRNFVLSENASTDYINYYTNVVRTLENTTSYRGKLFSSELVSKLAIENICLNFIGEPSLIFFKKDVIHEVGLFNNSLNQICDLDFALRIASKYGLTYLSEKLCAFRIHDTSTTSNNVGDKYFELHYIEPILFSYEILYNNQFKSLRTKLNFFQLCKLKMYFRLKIYKAYLTNVNENRSHTIFTEQNVNFKKILEYKDGNLFIKFLATIL